MEEESCGGKLQRSASTAPRRGAADGEDKASTKEKAGQLVGYDLTVAAAEVSVNDMFRILNAWAKKWVFQLEEGTDSGYRHYQCRIHLHVKRRLGEIVAKTRHLFPEGTSLHWSITSSEVHLGQIFNYVMKEDTRIEGPWTDDDYEEPPPLTRQLKVFHELQEAGCLYPWQTSVLQMVTNVDDRSIVLILDTYGNSGKSILCEHLEYMGLAYEIPPMRCMQEIAQVVMSVKAKKAYLVDLPRGMKKDRMAEFYSGLEYLKNGCAFDQRYKFRKKRFDRPQVLVFTNTLPDFSLMITDRWKIMQMQSDRSLIDMTETHLNEWREECRKAAAKKRNREDE